MKKKIRGPVIMRWNIQEIPEVRGRFLLDFRPEYHLGEHGMRAAEAGHSPLITHSAFQDEWEAQGRGRFGRVEPPAVQHPVTSEAHTETSLFPSRALTLKILGDIPADPDMIDELTHLFSRRLLEMFGALAYQAAALGESCLLLARLGKFESLIQREILKRVPFDVYMGSEILSELYLEMLSLVRFRRVLGPWGKVEEKDGEVWIVVEPSLPELQTKDEKGLIEDDLYGAL